MSMNINNINGVNLGVIYPIKNTPENPEILPGILKKETEENSVPIKDTKLPGSEILNKGKDENEKSWEDLVMKPSPLTLEERLAQVISAEQVRDLLSLITRSPLPEKDKPHTLDVKR